MNRPILVLQYPDPREGRTVAIAATRNPSVLMAFKSTVLEEARLAAMDWEVDEVLRTQDKVELQRLEELLGLLLPNDDGERELTET